MAGIVAYEPSEFVFTALAATPVAEIAAELGQHNQYLPFDPMLVRTRGNPGRRGGRQHWAARGAIALEVCATSCWVCGLSMGKGN